MKKLLSFCALAGATLLRAANPVPYTEGVSISFRIAGTGNGIMTVYGEGTVALEQFTYGTTTESGLGTAWLRPGKKYTVNFQASGPTNYWLSYTAPQGYVLYVNDTVTNLTASNPGGGWYSHDYTLELRPVGDLGAAEVGRFMGAELGKSVSWEVGLGRLGNGRSAGRIYFKEYDLTSNPAARDKAYYAPPPSFGEAWTIRDGPSNQRLRQVLVPQGVVDLLDDGAGGYWIRFFLWSQAEGSPGNPFILYGSPWKTIRVESPGANQLRLTETEGSAVRVTLITAPSAASGSYTWTAQEGGASGNWLRTTTHTSTPFTGYREVVAETRTGGTTGTVVAKTKFRFENPGGWGEELMQLTANPDGGSNALTTTYTYHTDGNAKGNYRRVRSVTQPTGQWAAWSYYDDWDRRGQLQYGFQPFLDSPATVTLNPASGRVVSLDYAADWTGRYTRPTVRQERINNVLTAQTGYANDNVYSADWPREFTNIFPWSSATAYVVENTEVYRADAGPDAPGLPYVHKRSDLSQVSYSYAGGYWDGSTFSTTAGIGWVRNLVLHGSHNSSGAESLSSWGGQAFAQIWLVPNKSTMEAVILRAGLPIRRETYVYTGSGNFSLMTWENLTYDNQWRLTQKVDNNGALTTYTYTNGLLTSTVGVDGTETQFTYDALWRVATTVKKGASSLASTLTSGYSYLAQGDITTTNTYDGASRITQTVTSGGSLSLTSSAVFDLAGRPTSQTAPGGYQTTFTYTNGGRTVTATLPGGSTRSTDQYLDGSAKSLGGTAQVNKGWTKWVAGDGTVATSEYLNSAWHITYTDWLGRKANEWWPGGDGINYSQYYTYNSNGQLHYVWHSDGRANRYFAYDTLGARIREGDDLNNNGLLDLASTDRITDHGYTFFESSGWWRRETTSTYATDNSGTATQTAKVESKLSNLTANRLSRVDRYDIFGNVTATYVDVDRTNKKITTTTDHPDSTTDSVGIAHNGLSVEAQDFAGLRFRSEYDALGRPWKSLDPRTGTTTTAYMAGTSLVSSITDPASVVTATYAYDTAGRVKSVATPNPNNGIGGDTRTQLFAYTAYTARGEIHRTWGDTAYPAEYTYDTYGRRTLMKTYRGGSGWNASTWPASPGTADLTKWVYDDATGNLKEKYDSANLDSSGNPIGGAKKVAYTYTRTNQPKTRTWARGTTTTYSYSTSTRELTSVAYSDSTPGVTYTYNRLGKTATVADYTGTRTYAYNLAGTLELQHEDLPSFFDNRRIAYGYDTATGVKGRYNQLNVTNSAKAYDGYSMNLGYDASGRPNAVWAYTYVYTANSHRIASISHSSYAWTQTRTYLSANDTLDVIETKWGATSKARFDYTHDNMYRVSTAAKTGEMFNTYGNGSQGLETDFTYNDRSELTGDSTALGGTSTPLTGRDDYHAYDPIGNRTSVNRSGTTLTFNANSLNQYTSFTGSATHTYDDDANLTNDGTWTYQWDAENRLIAQDSITHVRRLEFKYDYLGRRVQKTVRDGWNGTAYTTVPTDLRYLYDGWNVLYELNAGTLAKVRGYIWGLDLSGTWQGAGGVGGLLYMHDYATSTAHLPMYDGNGNITGYMNTSGTLTAKYEYDAFGQTVVATGSAVGSTPFRFATKYADTETGLVQYNTRYYSPSLGRFLNRDPISEDGGLNLYAYVTNNPVNDFDILGMHGAARRYHINSLDDTITMPPFVVTETPFHGNAYAGGWFRTPGSATFRLGGYTIFPERGDRGITDPTPPADPTIEDSTPPITPPTLDVTPPTVTVDPPTTTITPPTITPPGITPLSRIEVPQTRIERWYDTPTQSYFNEVGRFAYGYFVRAPLSLGWSVTGGAYEALNSFHNDPNAFVGSIATTVGDAVSNPGATISNYAGGFVGPNAGEQLGNAALFALPMGIAGTGARIATIETSAVRFTQNSIGATFRTGGTIDDLARVLRGPMGDSIARQIPPIRLVSHNGTLFTLDNRRLAAFAAAGRRIPYRMALPHEIAADWSSKFTTTAQQGWGQYITIRPPRG